MAGRNDSKANRLLGIALVGVVVAMVGAAYAAVPLYQLFCQVTGYGGTPQIAEAAPVAVGERVITVRFNADVDPALPWAFRPGGREMRMRVGEQGLASYGAETLPAHHTAGTP